MEDDEAAQKRRQRRMEVIDDLTPELRQCVYEYGLHIVTSFMDCGVKDANHIRHLVNVVLDEFSPTRGSNSFQGALRAPGFNG